MSDSPLTTAKVVGRAFWDLVIAQPVRNGRLGVRSWSPALRWVGAFALIGYVAATLLVLFAGPIRSTATFVAVGPDTYGVAWTLPLLSILLTLSLVLVITASLHLHWFLTFCVLLITAQTFAQVGFFVQEALYHWLAVAAFAGLIVLRLVRRRKRFHPVELAVVTACVLLGLQVPMVSARTALEFGLDNRGLLQASLLQLLGALAIPAIAVAGAALTQIAVTAGESAGSLVRDNAPRWLLVGMIAALVVWRGWVTVGDVVEVSGSWFSSCLVGSFVVLALSVGTAVVFVVRARRVRRLRAPGPGDLTEIYAPLMYVIAAGTAWWVLLMGPFVQVRDFSLVSTSNPAYPVVEWLASSVDHPLGPTVIRFAVAIGALWWGWRRAGRGDWLAGVLMACFFGPRLAVLLDRAGPDAVDRAGVFDFTDIGLDFWLYISTVIVLGYLVITRRANRQRLGWVAIALAIGTLYQYRAILEDPFSAVLGFSVVAVLLFGLIWRLLTDGEFLRADTPALPRDARILLFCANALFAVTSLAFVSLARSGRAHFDLSAWEALGDSVLAQPLYVAGVLVALACALAPSTFHTDVHDTTRVVGPAPRTPRSEAASIDPDTSPPHSASTRASAEDADGSPLADRR